MGANKVMDNTAKRSTDDVRSIIDDVQLPAAETICKLGEASRIISELDRPATILPHPCNGPLYADWTFPDYIKKMREELAEIEQAYNDIATAPNGTTTGDNAILVNSLFLECTDMITVVTSAMDAAKCDEHMRQEYQRRVNDSNAKRDGGRRVKQKYGKELK